MEANICKIWGIIRRASLSSLIFLNSLYSHLSSIILSNERMYSKAASRGCAPEMNNGPGTATSTKPWNLVNYNSTLIDAGRKLKKKKKKEEEGRKDEFDEQAWTNGWSNNYCSVGLVRARARVKAGKLWASVEEVKKRVRARSNRQYKSFAARSPTLRAIRRRLRLCAIAYTRFLWTAIYGLSPNGNKLGGI